MRPRYPEPRHGTRPAAPFLPDGAAGRAMRSVAGGSSAAAGQERPDEHPDPERGQDRGHRDHGPGSSGDAAGTVSVGAGVIDGGSVDTTPATMTVPLICGWIEHT